MMRLSGTIAVLCAALLGVTCNAFADDAAAPKQALKTNYQLVYNQKPGSAETFGEMFGKGVFYGRLRSNTFYYQWEEESASQNDP